MKIKSFAFVAAMICCANITNSALAAGTWKTRAMTLDMDATYKNGVGGVGFYTDGKGRYYEELTFFQHEQSNLIDSANHTQYSGRAEWSDGVALKAPYDEAHGRVIILTAADAKQRNATPIGTKVVQGHPSHGYKYVDGGNASEVWIADDIDAPVAGKFTNKEVGPISYTLKRYDPKLTHGAFDFPPNIQFKDAH